MSLPFAQNQGPDLTSLHKQCHKTKHTQKASQRVSDRATY